MAKSFYLYGTFYRKQKLSKYGYPSLHGKQARKREEERKEREEAERISMEAMRAS